MTGRNDALAQAMAAKGMNAGQLGRALGVLRTTVTHWRGGHRTPSRANAARVAELLGVPLTQLWPDLADPDPLAERRERIDRVAAAAGVTPATVRAWLAGRYQPGPLARATLAANGLAANGQPTPRPSRRNASSHPRPFMVREVLALPAQHDPKWRERARCATSPDPDLWWPNDDHDPEPKPARSAPAAPSSPPAATHSSPTPGPTATASSPACGPKPCSHKHNANNEHKNAKQREARVQRERAWTGR